MEPYRFVRHNRAPRTVAILIAVYAALASLIILFDAAWWLVALLALATLPALWDVFTDTSAGLSIEDGELRWFTGKRSGRLALGEIEHMRFDTRWDLSVRVSACLDSGKRVRLPDEALPPHRQFEQVLSDCGLNVIRHHFRVF
ncbi:hypothetical protein FGK63_10865 [Ruegeria sediminis]|uniref:DUF2244 domain-containing protein n=2 Tax=Ruegeria sediminis TaxID=2583820 RepID=A0ABY2WYJ8_9RHOB|nr:hypothetical protein FGK63_10865 [Ruegeria sediminis]